ncbi:MAG: hypothetical protein NTX53_06920 [candidate division WOR-3 bacterium]|nr:hypothetical protein [candidate division WOR-3 bacterium]
MSIAEVKAKAVPVLRRHGALRAGLFGSVVRGEDRAGRNEGWNEGHFYF